MTPQQATTILESINQNRLGAVVFNVIRAIERENWFHWSGQEAQEWIEQNIRERNEFSEDQTQAIAMLSMHQFLRSRNAYSADVR